MHYCRNKELLDQVQMLNAVRRLQAGRTISSAFLTSLIRLPAESLEFLLQVWEKVLLFSFTSDVSTALWKLCPNWTFSSRRHWMRLPSLACPKKRLAWSTLSGMSFTTERERICSHTMFRICSFEFYWRYLYQALKKDHPSRIKLSDLLTTEENKDLHSLDADANFHRELEEQVKLSGKFCCFNPFWRKVQVTRMPLCAVPFGSSIFRALRLSTRHFYCFLADDGGGSFEEDKLLHSYYPTEIRSLVKSLLGKMPKHNVMYLSDKV